MSKPILPSELSLRTANYNHPNTPLGSVTLMKPLQMIPNLIQTNSSALTMIHKHEIHQKHRSLNTIYSKAKDHRCMLR